MPIAIEPDIDLIMARGVADQKAGDFRSEVRWSDAAPAAAGRWIYAVNIPLTNAA
jgi:hypothetical protein